MFVQCLQTPCSKTVNDDGDQLENRICNRIIPEIASAIKDGFMSLASVWGGQKMDAEGVNAMPSMSGPAEVPARMNTMKSHSAARSTSAVKLDFVVDLANEGMV